jgi:hypothetical protein
MGSEWLDGLENFAKTKVQEKLISQSLLISIFEI